MAPPRETKDGSSSEMEPMEASTPCLLGKRKAEDPEEGEGEGEGEGDEEDSSGWDKDSFDGLEYNSSDYSGFLEPSDNYPRYRWNDIVSVTDDDLENEIDKGITVREFLGNIASECVEKYNKRKQKNVKFDHFLRANFNPGGRTKYCITFAATENDSPHAPLVEYQAKVARCAGNTYPILCRPTKIIKRF